MQTVTPGSDAAAFAFCLLYIPDYRPPPARPSGQGKI
jgi:hypothetical protein